MGSYPHCVRLLEKRAGNPTQPTHVQQNMHFHIREAETTQMHCTDSKNPFSWAISTAENIASTYKKWTEPHTQKRGWMRKRKQTFRATKNPTQWSLEISSAEFWEVAVVDVVISYPFDPESTQFFWNQCRGLCVLGQERIRTNQLNTLKKWGEKTTNLSLHFALHGFTQKSHVGPVAVNF